MNLLSDNNLEIQASSEQERLVLYKSLMNAPLGIAVFKGATHIYEFANAEYEIIATRKITIGKTLQEHFPELEQQGLIQVLNNVFVTGVPFVANEFPIEVKNLTTGKLVLGYYNLVVKPIKDEKGTVERLISYTVEVTKQATAVKKLEEANQNLRIAATLTENIADAIIGTDIDNKIISWNKGSENLYGYTSAEVMGKQARSILRTQFLSDKDKNDCQHNLDMVGKWQGEVIQSKKDDILINVLVSLAYVYDDNGNNNAIVSVTRDITERKKASEIIEESEKQFRNFANSIQNLAWIANGEGWIYWYNQRWFDYTGTNLEQMEGWGWQKVHHPDHIQRIIEIKTELWKKDEAFELTFPLKRHDGVYRWFLTRAYPIKNATGTVERWIGTNTDITEQKSFAADLESQVKLRAEELYLKNKTFEFAEKIAKFGSYKWNVASDVLEYSDNLYRLLDCEPKEFVPTFEKFLTFVHPDDLSQVIANAEASIQTGIAHEMPYRIISKTGVIKFVSTIGTFFGKGEDYAFVGVLQDISKEIESEQRLKSKNLELETTNAELKSFTHIASHDLQEPLRKIQTFSKRILDAETFSDKTQDYFDRIIASSERMQNLIVSLLDFSRSERSDLIFLPCDLNTIIEESKNDLYLKIVAKQAIIEYQNLPTINGNYIQLSQLFTNLIDNSIKYSRPDCKPHINISVSCIKGSLIEHHLANKLLNYYEIQFADNGIGFNQEYENKIFEVFQRLHHKNEYSGTGIGLSIVKRVITNHNGIILASGKPEVGATFTIYLPVIYK